MPRGLFLQALRPQDLYCWVGDHSVVGRYQRCLFTHQLRVHPLFPQTGMDTDTHRAGCLANKQPDIAGATNLVSQIDTNRLLFGNLGNEHD
jgi:hypothetical protein